MDLVKIYTDKDFENAVIPEGRILTYIGEEDGQLVTKYKDKDGNFGTIAGGGSNQPTVDVVAGYFVNTDGQIAFKALDGTTESVQEISIVDTGVDEPAYNKCSAGVMDFYKCASVDTANKTWTGYKAVLTDGVYSFEDNATTGLEYSNGYIPVVGGIYDQSTTVKVTKLYDGSEYPIPREGLIFYAPLQTDYVDVISGKSAQTIGGDFTVHNGVNCLYLDGSEYIEWDDMAKNASEYTLLLLVCPTYLYDWRRFMQLVGDEGHFDISAKNGHLKEWGGEYMEESVWQTVAITTTQDKYGRSYLNGVLNGTNNGKSDYVATFNSITVGSNKDEGYIHNVEGYVAFAAVYNRVLSDTEIADIHNELMSNINE